MLTVSPLMVDNTSKDNYMATDFADVTTEDLPDFTMAGDFQGSLDLLEGFDYYDDLFIGFDGVGDDVLPDLEIDVGEYSGSGRDEEQETEGNISTASASETSERDGGDQRKPEVGGDGMAKTVRRGKRRVKKNKNSLSVGNQIKKKPKVDWTPELHRKFVQAVEQLGIDKAVPSRILQIMNVKSLTRHNVASHLQKYRSHRRHVLARDAETASWILRRHATVAVARGGGGKKPLMAPALGYPPHGAPMHHGHFRPLHVWGHPSWPKHKPTNPPSDHRAFPIPAVAVAPPPSWPGHPPYWHPHPLYPPQGYGMAVAPSSNHSMYIKSETSIGVPTRPLGPTNLHFDIHPSDESIDAAIGDVITKPWLPLPLGLNPPSTDGVMTELQRQGISKVPPRP